MTNEQTTALVLKDGMGNYFLVPQETLERGRVPEEHKAEVERLISEQHDDVRGHSPALGLGGAIAFMTGILIGIKVGEAVKPVADAPSPAFPQEAPEIRVGFVRV